MDVFSVGAGAPKAPESNGVEREPGQTRQTDRSRAILAGGDQFSASPDAATVNRFVEKLNEVTDVRDDVIRGFRELLGRGLLDSPEAARRAAQGILDS